MMIARSIVDDVGSAPNVARRRIEGHRFGLIRYRFSCGLQVGLGKRLCSGKHSRRCCGSTCGLEKVSAFGGHGHRTLHVLIAPMVEAARAGSRHDGSISAGAENRM